MASGEYNSLLPVGCGIAASYAAKKIRRKRKSCASLGRIFGEPAKHGECVGRRHDADATACCFGSRRPCSTSSSAKLELETRRRCGLPSFFGLGSDATRDRRSAGPGRSKIGGIPTNCLQMTSTSHSIHTLDIHVFVYGWICMHACMYWVLRPPHPATVRYYVEYIKH